MTWMKTSRGKRAGMPASSREWSRPTRARLWGTFKRTGQSLPWWVNNMAVESGLEHCLSTCRCTHVCITVKLPAMANLSVSPKEVASLVSFDVAIVTTSIIC